MMVFADLFLQIILGLLQALLFGGFSI